MKRFNKTVASLLILIGMGAITVVSCEKVKTTKCHGVKIVVHDLNEKGGEDDEDPIIRGRVRKHNLTPIDSAYVETCTSMTNIKIGGVFTDADGKFKQQVPVGTYYFKIAVPGNPTTYITDTVNVSKDINIDIYIN